MSEVARLRGLLREKELKAKELEIRMAGHLDALYAALPRHTPMIELAAKAAAQEAIELAAVQMTLRGLLKDIDLLRKDLGEQA